MIYIGSIKDLKEDYDEVWMIVRSLKAVPQIPHTPVFHIPSLSPSLSLFHQYIRWREEGKWNKDTFQNQYAPQFLKEMKREEPLTLLSRLAGQSRKKNILLVCYCTEESKCHRSIVFGLLQGMGALTDETKDYRNYYTEWIQNAD